MSRHVGGLCLFCDPSVTGVDDPRTQLYTHDRKKCPLFRSLKSGLNNMSYCATSLEASEARGFAAAGIIFVTRARSREPEFLVSRELKKQDARAGEVDKLNFLGGKRLLSSQAALDVAVQRANWETGALLSDAKQLGKRSLPLVYWDGQNKYVYFFIELTAELDIDVDWRCAGIAGTHRLEWMGMSQLLDPVWVRTEFHPYAASSVLGLKHAGVLQRLMEIFDAAAAASQPAEEYHPDTSSYDATAKFDYDVVSAILNAAELRDGMLRPKSRVVDAFQALPKPDVRKLQLRFHPDKLEKQLARRATDEEIALSTAAFQLFNNIGDRVPRLQEQLKDLESKIERYMGAKEDKRVGAGDASTEIASLLSQMNATTAPRRRQW